MNYSVGKYWLYLLTPNNPGVYYPTHVGTSLVTYEAWCCDYATGNTNWSRKAHNNFFKVYKPQAISQDQALCLKHIWAK